MRAIYRIALTAFTGLVLAVALANNGIAQQQTKSAKEQLVGTWLLVSEITYVPRW